MSQWLEHNDFSQLRLHSLCIDVTTVGQTQASQKTLLMCLNLPYHFDINTPIEQP